MTQDSVEQKRDIKWIVPLPQGEGGMFGRPSLCAACRGNEDIGVVLNYFVFEASREAKNKKIDLDKTEYIRLKRGLDEILDGIKPSRTSKTTLIGYHHKLHEWGLVLSDGYKQQYDVYFHKITEAIQSPPPEEKRKPRGRHVAKLPDSSFKDSSFNRGSKLESSTVKTGIQEDFNFNQISILTSQISKLEFEISNLKSEMSALTFEISNLKSLESSEAAPQQAGKAQNNTLRLLRDCNRLLETIKSNVVARRNVFSLLTEEDYQTIDELMTVTSVASATPSPLIENLYQSLGEIPSADPGGFITTQPEQTPPGTPLTPAGSITVLEGENIQPETPAHHNAILEPPCNATVPLTQESATIPQSENAPSESPLQPQEMPSSTQAVNDLSNQATEQSQQQASGDSLIAGVTTKNPPATNNTAPQKPRGGRGKSAASVAKEEKPKLEMIKTPPQMPPAEMAWGTRKCMQKFDARRGTLLIGTYLISQASTCAKGLAESYTEEDVDLVTAKMNNDPYWIARGGADICDVARNIHKEMNKLKPRKNAIASSSQSTGMRPATPITSMTRDEASKLAHDAIVEAKQYNIVVAAQAAPLENNPDTWIVRVRWDDGSKDGMVYSIRTRGQWGKRLKEIQKMVDKDAKIALRRMEAK